MIKRKLVALCGSPDTRPWLSSRTGFPRLLRDLTGTGFLLQQAAEHFSTFASAEIPVAYPIMHPEHRILVKGAAETTKGVNLVPPTEGKSTHTPISETHRVADPGAIHFDTIDVQSGNRRRQHEIARIEESYARN